MKTPICCETCKYNAPKFKYMCECCEDYSEWIHVTSEQEAENLTAKIFRAMNTARAAKEPLGPTGFVRDAHAGKGRMDLLPWIGIMEVSRLCEEGAKHYGERNIDKGAPLHSLLDSGARHLAKVMSGYTDEDHLRSACWNLLWALQERTTHPELNDTPWPWYGETDNREG